MTQESKLKLISLTELADLCARETERFFNRQEHDSGYCFELFHRAIRDDDQVAWQMIYNQYQSLVAGWVLHHRGFETSGEEVEYFVTGAFGKLSKILTSEKLDDFSDLQSLLRYLKMCVHSVITDHNRLDYFTNQVVSFEELTGEVGSADPAPEEEAAERIDNQAFWVRIDEKLQDEKERLVIKGTFILALKPRELCDLHKNMFSDVSDVYRIKQNVLARLRRDPEFRKFLAEDD